MPAHKFKSPARKFAPFDYKYSARTAARRLRRLNAFTAHEEEQLSIMNARPFAGTAAPNGVSTHPRQLISASVRESARPYPSTPQQRSLKRAAPATSALSALPPSHISTHSAFNGLKNTSVGSHIDPTGPNTWNLSKFTHGTIGQASGRLLRQSGAPGLQTCFPTLNSAAHFTPDSPPLSPLFDLGDPRGAQPSSAPLEAALPQAPDAPNAAHFEPQSDYGTASPPETLHAPSPSTIFPIDIAGGSQVANMSSDYLIDEVAPLPLLSPMHLGPAELRAKLAKGRFNFQWDNWEHQTMVYGLLGPRAPANLIRHLVLPLSQLGNHECWLWLSKGMFSGSRTTGALLTQWSWFRDVYLLILHFLESLGVDLGDPKFKDPQVLVKVLIVAWTTNVDPADSWGTTSTKLTTTTIASWTHDQVNGWLATIHGRLQEAGVQFPPRKDKEQPHLISSSTFLNTLPRFRVIAPSATITAVSSPHQATSTSPDQLDNSPFLPAQPIQVTQPAQRAETPTHAEIDTACPVPEDDSTESGMSHQQRAIGTSSVPLFHSKADYIHSLAMQARAETLGYVVRLEQQEREMRLNIALSIIHTHEPTSATRIAAESWLKCTFFSSHPSDDFNRMFGEWKAKLDITPAQLTYDSSLERMFATPPFPSPPFEDNGPA
ncbi:hypothetical protein FRC07_013640 [Ceratobasidium sp. 392]|nr:hypothetical protein FRC07_013640 [Ceratobasidium sp. 392]